MRVYIEIGNVCNLSCSFCPRITREKRQMNEGEFRRVMTECAPVASEIYFHLMGEPLLHPMLDTFLSIAEEFGIPVCITCNGTLLSKKGYILLQHAKIIKKVSISLQSFESNSKKQTLSAYIGECVDFAKKACKEGIYSIFRLWNLSREDRAGENKSNGEILALLHKAYPEEWQERYSGYRIGKNTFIERAEIFDWPTESMAQPDAYGHCYGLLDQIGVLADGTVVPCCLDAEGEIALGNLYESTLEKILASARACRMRDGLKQGNFTEPLCQKCTYSRRFS